MLSKGPIPCRRVRGCVDPALLRAAELLPLTGRECEIVMLLADGLSTREVAERLTSSARTVEGHVYRGMAKTGTNSREEVTALLPRRGRDHDRTARLAP